MGSRRGMAESDGRLEAHPLTIVSHRRKFIFIRPRKVAGTSLQVSLSRWLGEDDIVSFSDYSKVRAFNRRTDDDDFGAVRVRRTDRGGEEAPYADHDLPEAIREKVGETVWASYFKFTVARNPWDLLVSMLYFKHSSRYWRDVWVGRGRNLRDTARNLPKAFRTLQLRREFARGRWKESVEAILREGWYQRPIESIPRFYFSRGQACADYVIRFETLQQGYDEVCRRLELPPQILPGTNTRQRPKKSDYRDYYTDFSREYVADLCRPMIAAFGYRFGARGPGR